MSGRRVADAFRSLVNARNLQLESCMKHCWCLFLRRVVKRIWREEKIWVVQMDNLRGLLGIWRMDKVPNTQIWQLCKETKCMDKKIDEGVL